MAVVVLLLFCVKYVWLWVGFLTRGEEGGRVIKEKQLPVLTSVDSLGYCSVSKIGDMWLRRENAPPRLSEQYVAPSTRSSRFCVDGLDSLLCVRASFVSVTSGARGGFRRTGR